MTPDGERRYDVCVLGSFMKDLVTRAPRRPERGETLHGTDFDEYLGGKGVNQAVAASRAGARTAMVGRLGKDQYGEEFLALLDTGALAARIAAGASLIDAARYANAAGALATTVPGAVPAMPHDATIRALLGADTSSTGPDSENMPHSPFE